MVENKLYVLMLFVLCGSAVGVGQVKVQSGKVGRDFQISNNAIVSTNLKLVEAADTAGWVAFKNWDEGYSVAAENDSIVWVGTKVGLVRWNVTRSTYTTYDKSNGLEFCSINDLAFDRQGRLWIATDEGLAVFDDGAFSYYDTSNSPLPDDQILDLAIDSTGRIYMGVGTYISNNTYYPGAVAEFDGTHWQIYTQASSVYAGDPQAICVYKDTVWISADANGIFTLANGRMARVTNWPSYVAPTAFAVDNQDSLWVDEGNQLYKYSDFHWNLEIDGTKEGGHWYQISNDPAGGLWLYDASGWDVAGISPYRLDFEARRDSIQYSQYLPKGVRTIPGLNKEFNAHCAVDSDHQFFATRWGLLEYNGKTLRSFNIAHSLLSNVVYSLGTSPKGEIYMSEEMAKQKTNGVAWDSIGGLGWIDPQIRFHPDGTYWSDGINGQFMSGVDFDSHGDEWGAQGSVYELDSSGLREWTGKDMGINHDANFLDVAIDRDDNLWACGHYFPAAMYNGTQWNTYPWTDSTLPNGSYDMVYADSKGRVWFGTNQQIPNYGFTVLDSSKWVTYSSAQRPAIANLYQVAEDAYGNIWLATGGGLLEYNGKTFTVYDDTNSPLATNLVYAVTVDDANNIWVGTSGGLYVYCPHGVAPGYVSNETAVDSFSVAELYRASEIHIYTHPHPGQLADYVLERGNGPYRFWPISRTGFVEDTSSTITIEDRSPKAGRCYYRIERIGENGKISVSSSSRSVYNPLVYPKSFTLSDNYPNPFNGYTTFQVFVPEESRVVVQIYNILGQKVMPDIVKDLSSGRQTLTLNLSSLASGVYLYRVDCAGTHVNGKLMLIK